jgi:outer membrane biosynthesis protein TonB
VEEINSQSEEQLATELEQARQKLDGLESQLRDIDGELESLSTERQRYQLLHEVCGGLEKLGEIGGEGLFWDGAVADGRGDDHVHIVRRRIDEFNRRLSDIEAGRKAIVEKINGAQDDTDYLEEDVRDAARAEEQRRLEWVPDREITDLPARPTVMPWMRGGEDDKRFRKTLAASILISLLFGLLFPLIDIPLADPWAVEEVPERFARLIKEAQPPPPPPEPVEQKVAETKPGASEEPQVVEEKVTQAKPEPVKKKAAQSKGILAFRDQFSGLSENKAAARLGAQARINRSGEPISGRKERSMVTTQGAGSSGGINLATLSRGEVGGGGKQIEGVEVSQATSSIGDITGEARPLSGGPGPARTDEEIQIVFDRHKSALYRLYNRELRRDPTLKGQIVLRFVIEPDGSVSLCEIQSTDMNAPKLGAQVVGRVKTFDFGTKEGVPAVSILYPIDFLPAT